MGVKEAPSAQRPRLWGGRGVAFGHRDPPLPWPQAGLTVDVTESLMLPRVPFPAPGRTLQPDCSGRLRAVGRGPGAA